MVTIAAGVNNFDVETDLPRFLNCVLIVDEMWKVELWSSISLLIDN